MVETIVLLVWDTWSISGCELSALLANCSQPGHGQGRGTTCHDLAWRRGAAAAAAAAAVS